MLYKVFVDSESNVKYVLPKNERNEFVLEPNSRLYSGIYTFHLEMYDEDNRRIHKPNEEKRFRVDIPTDIKNVHLCQKLRFVRWLED